MTAARKFRKSLEVLLVRAGILVIPGLPRPVVLRLARLAGWLAYALARDARRIGRANLDLVYADTMSAEEKNRILRESLRTFALAVLDVFWFSRKTRERVLRFVAFDEQAADIFQDKAHLCVTAHMGNWEVLGHAMAVRGYPMVSVAAPLANPGVEGFFQAMRERAGQTVIPREGAVKVLLKTLRNGGKVGLLLDQNTRPEQGGVFVDFFGLPATVSPAAASLALRTGAGIYLGFCIPRADGTYRVLAPHPELMAPADQPDPRQATRHLTATIAGVMEAVIRSEPSSWLWSYKRWKYIPDGADPAAFPFYARPLVRTATRPGERSASPHR